jgi:hypothetical protein
MPSGDRYSTSMEIGAVWTADFCQYSVTTEVQAEPASLLWKRRLVSRMSFTRQQEIRTVLAKPGMCKRVLMRLLLPGELELVTALWAEQVGDIRHTFARIAKNRDSLCYGRPQDGETLCIRQKGLETLVPELGRYLLNGLDGAPRELIAKLEAFLKARKEKRMVRCSFGSNIVHSARISRLLGDALRRGW